jgi:hypothetical protein
MYRDRPYIFEFDVVFGADWITDALQSRVTLAHEIGHTYPLAVKDGLWRLQYGVNTQAAGNSIAVNFQNAARAGPPYRSSH